MDSFQQINLLFPQDDHDSIVKSQITNNRFRNSSKEEAKDKKKQTTTSGITESSKTTKNLYAETGSSRKAIGSLPKPKLPFSIRTKKATGENSSRDPFVNTRKEHGTRKMSDWGDEETTEVIGKGFGNDNDVYKSNNDDYQNDDENNNNGGHKKRFNGGGGGRGGGRSGNGFNRYNKDNEDNGEPDANKTHEHYQNPVFALTPKDYLQETLHYFMNNMPELFQKATLIQKYTLLKYLMEAYERILKRSSETTKKHKPHYKKPDTKTKNRGLQHLQSTSAEGTLSPTMLRSYAIEQDEESLIEFPEQLLFPSPESDVAADLLQIFQQDANKYWAARDASTQQHNSYQLEFEENITFPLPSPQLPAINISDLFENENLNDSDEFQLTFFKPPQIQQPESATHEEIIPRRSERLQAQDLTNFTANERLPPSNVSTQRLRYSLRSSNTAHTLTTNSDSTAETPKRLKPRTYITEEEYSLRFRLPRRRFLEISELPRVKYNIETSSFAYFPMDMSLIEEEYSSFIENETNDNNLVTVQLQSTNLNLHEPPTTLPLTTSVLAATTGDNLSSLNVVRQAPSSMMELSSFARPLPPVVPGIDVSLIKEERSLGILQQDMSPRVETVGVLNNDVNVSTNSASSGGPHVAEGESLEPQPQQLEHLNVVDETPLLRIEPPPQMTADSGIHLPTSNLHTTDTALVSSSNIDTGPRSIARDQMAPDPPISSDTGIFKTPQVPAHKILQPTQTMSSVEEKHFQSNLKTRFLDVSTPLTSQILQERKTLLTQIEAETTNTSDVEGSEINRQSEQVILQSASIREQAVLQPILETRESHITPLVMSSNGKEAYNQLQNKHAVDEVNQPIESNLTYKTTADNDYRKDWYEILRTRLLNTNFKNATTPQRKPKNRRPRRRLALINQISQLERVEQQRSKNQNLLQQTLAGILPPISNNSPVQNINTSPAVNISSQQQQYDQFILENSANISTIMDNLNSCRTILDNHRRGLQAKLTAGTVNRSVQHFDPSVLLNACQERLVVKLGILQNIIRQVSFDFTKCDCVTNRMTAAIGFAFILELKSSGIINLSADGRTVALC